LALLVSAQFFISLEMLANTAELCLVGIVLLGIVHRDQVRAKLPHAATGVMTAVAVLAITLSYPLWFALFGPQHGTIFASPALAAYYANDLLGPIVPTSNQLLTTPALSRLGDRFSGGLVAFDHVGRMVTNGAYVGLPLVMIVAAFAIRYRRLAVVRIFTLMTLVAFVASLGPSLKIGGEITNIRMPGRVLLHLPLLEATYPYRYGPFLALGVAVLFAIGVDRLHRRSSDRLTRPPIRSLPPVPISATLALVMISALAPLVPAQPYPTVKLSTPQYFRSSAVSAIAPGSVVLTYPPPAPFSSKTMIWQASAGLRFRMVGAYMFAQDGEGVLTLAPNHGVTERALYDIWAGNRPTVTLEALHQTLLGDLRSWHVSTVIVAINEPHSTEAVTLFTDVLGRPPVSQEEVAAWYGLASG
jgi:hypothetical protein